MRERYRYHTDENQSAAPVYSDGRYLLPYAGDMIEIVPSAPKHRRRTRWWRAVLGGLPLTDWLATPRIVAEALKKGNCPS